ncbi:MAG: hypothetical protein H0T79_03005 [Deltaproteobacteria bacterium]|nr:hypothetical protein [Deltaproteobacteria bacterium]
MRRREAHADGGEESRQVQREVPLRGLVDRMEFRGVQLREAFLLGLHRGNLPRSHHWLHLTSRLRGVSGRADLRIEHGRTCRAGRRRVLTGEHGQEPVTDRTVKPSEPRGDIVTAALAIALEPPRQLSALARVEVSESGRDLQLRRIGRFEDSPQSRVEGFNVDRRGRLLGSGGDRSACQRGLRRRAGVRVWSTLAQGLTARRVVEIVEQTTLAPCGEAREVLRDQILLAGSPQPIGDGAGFCGGELIDLRAKLGLLLVESCSEAALEWSSQHSDEVGLSADGLEPERRYVQGVGRCAKLAQAGFRNRELLAGIGTCIARACSRALGRASGVAKDLVELLARGGPTPQVVRGQCRAECLDALRDRHRGVPQ